MIESNKEGENEPIAQEPFEQPDPNQSGCPLVDETEEKRKNDKRIEILRRKTTFLSSFRRVFPEDKPVKWEFLRQNLLRIRLLAKKKKYRCFCGEEALIDFWFWLGLI